LSRGVTAQWRKTDAKQGMRVWSISRVISDKGKPKNSEMKLSMCTVHIIKPTWTAMGSNPELRRHKPASYLPELCHGLRSKSYSFRL